MSEHSNEPPGPPGPPPGPTQAPGHGHPAPPPSGAGQPGYPSQPGYPAQPGYPSQQGYPTQPGGPQGAGPTQPMPQWYPAVPRRPFRERTTKLWLALVVGLVCLLVGLGAGIPIGHAIGHDDRDPGRFDRFPGGPGYRYHDGRRFGGGGNGPVLPNRSQPPLPQSPGATG